MSEVEYQKHYYPGTRDELVTRLREQLSDFRFEHVVRVEHTAVKLASRYGVDEEKASVAGLVHDYAKECSDEQFKAVIQSEHLDPDLLNWGNFIWHGEVGARIIRRDLGITDQEILDAVRFHTVGAPHMTPLQQLTYVADFIEPGRDFPDVATARAVAQTSLEQAVVYETKHTLTYLMANDRPIYPAAIATYNAWIGNRK